MANHADFDNHIASSVRTVVPDADADLIAKVTRGVEADPVWGALGWMDAKTAEGALADGLAEKAVTLAKAIAAATGNVQPPPATPAKNDAQSIAAAFGMSMEQWRSTPPETKSRLAAALADKQANDQHRAASVASLKSKIASNTATPDQKLEYARLTEEEDSVTKAQRRDPRFIQAQQARMSLSELRKIKYAHDVEAASGAYPPTYRKMHQDHADRIGRIIKEREDAGEV